MEERREAPRKNTTVKMKNKLTMSLAKKQEDENSYPNKSNKERVVLVKVKTRQCWIRLFYSELS